MPIINSQVKPFKAQAYHNGDFKTVTEESLKGKWSVFVFYPADSTFVCPTEPGDLAARVTAAVAVRLAETGWSGHGLNALGQDTVQRYFARLRQHYGVLDLDALTPTESEDYLQIGLASVFVEQSVRADPPPAEMPREWRQRVPANGHLSSEDVPAEVNPTDLVHLQESYRAKPLQRLFDVLASPEQRAVVELTYFYGLAYTEIAGIVGCPVNTVKTRMFHARRRLRALLDGELGDWL